MIILYYINEDIFDLSLLEQVSASDKSREESEEAERRRKLEEARLALEEKESEATIALEREVQFMKLEMDYNAVKSNGHVRDDISQLSVGVLISKFGKFIQKFDELDLITFFASFEETARNCEWPDHAYTALLNTVLTGKGARKLKCLIT